MHNIDPLLYMAIVVIVAWIISTIATGALIPFLKKKQMGQNIREDGPQSHLSKAGTPSMGGIAIVLTLFAVSLAMGPFTWTHLIASLSFVLFGLIGFCDDYLKVIKKQNEGFTPGQKFGMQFGLALAYGLYFTFFGGADNRIYIPFANMEISLGFLYLPFLIFAILAMTNGVNLTDGLDGLAAQVTFVVSIFFAIKAAQFGYMGVMVAFAAVAGACAGFAMHNRYPAKVFMGDTGSLALGGGLAVLAIQAHMELFLVIVGIIYVLETLSVVLQVAYFKATHGKRLFRMAPLHHHFEEGGMKETKVVALFVGITFVAAIISIYFG